MLPTLLFASVLSIKTSWSKPCSTTPTRVSFADTLMNIYGCDSIVITDLLVNPTHLINQNFTICQGQSIPVGMNNYNMTGIYTDTLMNIFWKGKVIFDNDAVIMQLLEWSKAVSYIFFLKIQLSQLKILVNKSIFCATAHILQQYAMWVKFNSLKL